MSSPNFNKLLLDISNQLSGDHLAQLKFLVREQVGKKDLERVTSGLVLFQILTERELLAAGRTDYLAGLLRDIHRDDLSDRLTDSGPDDPEPDPEAAKLDAAAPVVAENLGRSWRKLGRRLGLSEARLESVAGRHPSDLEEAAVELLKEWRRTGAGRVQIQDLIQALRACQFNLTADRVEDRLKELGLC
ncbi:FAS-associated death domain protein [Salarias fasciatus]|uniref:Fas (tnfrsf6)-associated via death domain n=1 Tax=Salarias fasciatus TaxID=181472 RepID=A0A672G0S4_SALFA|nr:FAS-associated death domain protein [Salarias fasciatus]